MDKKYLLLILLLLVAITLLLFFDKKENQNNITETEDGIIFFYQTGCSFCNSVEKYIEDNKIEEKISIRKRDVLNKSNSNLMTQKADICGLSMNNVGVPFLWTGEKCLIGEKDILNFFQSEI
jgi:thioredoxin-related protein